MNQVIHWLIILNFFTGMLYAAYQIFVVARPYKHIGPLFHAAKRMDPKKMMVRRMYAIEFWIIFSGFVIYLALTVA